MPAAYFHPSPDTFTAPGPDAVGTSDGPAEAILAAYDAYVDAFLEITRRARGRFLRREWSDGQRDAAERLTLYSGFIDRTVDELRPHIRPLGGDGRAPYKSRYAALTADRPDGDVARTFFNSVVRRILGTSGVDARTDFTGEPSPALPGDGAPLYVAHPANGLTAESIATVLRACELGGDIADLPGDAELCAAAAREQLGERAEGVVGIDALPFLFYRNKAAYLVARIRRANARTVPLLIPLLHPPEGVRADAVLTDPDEVHRVFSFARSYFHALTARPCETVAFLRTLMPTKPVHELYTSIGRHRHGKTELYRELSAQLGHPAARFEPAEGIPGLVMIVFTLPAFNVVFKVIRDRLKPPKDATPDEVKQKYRLVFARDRVGRLADAQEFEHLHFPRDRFAPELLDELMRDAAGSVRVEGDDVVIRHLYTERRIRPLDLYLRESPAPAAEAAVLEYGNAIKDLACANIFPGDLLLKNFGVSRHGRVIFYDYDELALLSEVRFRAMPTARYEDEEMSAEPWFSVDDRDVFPEQWMPFLIPPGPLRQKFLEQHADLLTVAWWRTIQRRQENGDLPDFFAYPQTRRLRRDPA